MDDLEQTVQRGNSARQILVEPVFVDARQALKDKYLKELLDSDPKDSGKRESAYLKIKVLEDVMTELTIVQQRGVKASNDIKTRKHRATQ